MLLLLLLLSRFSRVRSVRPHRRQPTRLPRPWDSPGKNTGVGCHFLLQCMKVKSESEVAQSCPTLSDPVDCSPPGSSIHGIFQARVLEWGAIAFSATTAQPESNPSSLKSSLFLFIICTASSVSMLISDHQATFSALTLPCLSMCPSGSLQPAHLSICIHPCSCFCSHDWLQRVCWFPLLPNS